MFYKKYKILNYLVDYYIKIIILLQCCRLLTYIVIQLINQKNENESLAEILDKVGVEF